MPNPVPAESHVQALTEQFLPQLRPAQQRGLALWVAGMLEAKIGREAAILSVLEPLGAPVHALRDHLREWLYDGGDRAAPCGISLEVATCFAALLAWVVRWWVGDTLPLAIAATRLRERQVVLAIGTLLSLAVGTRLEDAAQRGIPPGLLRRPRTRTPPPAHPRQRSLFTRGRRCWRAWWWPEALPALPADLTVIRHVATPGGAHT